MITLLIVNSIAWSQDSSGGKWYTYEQRKQCIECLINQPIIDSMLTDCEAERINLKKDFDRSVKIIEDLRLEAIEQRDTIYKLKNQRKVLLSISGGLVAVVLILVTI